MISEALNEEPEVPKLLMENDYPNRRMYFDKEETCDRSITGLTMLMKPGEIIEEIKVEMGEICLTKKT